MKFEDSKVEECNFAPFWNQNTAQGEAGSQTDNLSAQQMECQTVERTEIGVQSEDSASQHAPVQQSSTIDLTGLGDFLTRVEPEIIRILKENVSTRKLFQQMETMLAQNRDFKPENTHNLRHTEDNKEELEVMGVDWNCAGTTLAVAMGLSNHDDWCSHTGFIHTWSMDSRSVDPAKANQTLASSSCVTCLKWHPRKPALLASGSFTGQLVIWDFSVSSDDGAAADQITSRPATQTHKEPVSAIVWLSIDQQERLLTSAFDGKILLWAIPDIGDNMDPVQCFQIISASLPRDLNGGRPVLSDKEVGITAIDISAKNPTLFLVGTETGALFQCSLDSTETVHYKHVGEGVNVPVYSPVVLSLKPCKGPIYAICGAKSHPNVFIVAAGDGFVRLYDVLQTMPIVSMNCVIGDIRGISWSPSRPLLIGCVGGQGSVALIDLARDLTGPVGLIDFGDKSSTTTNPKRIGIRGHSVAFNRQNGTVIAAGDSKGVTHVWRLGNAAVALVGDEDATFESIIKQNNNTE